MADAPLTEQDRFLLVECVQAYLPLTEESRAEYERIIQRTDYAKVQAMNKTVFEQGIEKGRGEGERIGLLRATTSLLTNRFGPLPESITEALRSFPIERLEELLPKISTAESLTALKLPE